MKNVTTAVAQSCHLFIILLFSLLITACSGKGDATGSAAAPGDSLADEDIEAKPVSRPLLASYETNFIGEWKSLESEKRDHMLITQNGKNFVIQEGDDVIPGIYDKENKVIRMNVGAPLDIMYLEKEDMLVVSGGGKYRRITSK